MCLKEFLNITNVKNYVKLVTQADNAESVLIIQDKSNISRSVKYADIIFQKSPLADIWGWQRANIELSKTEAWPVTVL